MRRATLRSLLAHKLRLALSAVAIVLGVAFVAGTMIFTDTLDRTFTDLFESTASDVAVTPEGGTDGVDGPAGTLSVPGALVGQVRAVDGVAAAEGYVQAQGVYLLTPAGEVLDTGGAPGIGISWTSAPGLDTGELTAGRAPERAGEVALDSGSAAEAGYAVGDRVTLLTPGPRVEATVVGVFTFGEDGGLAGASLTAFDVATAQQLTGVGDGFSGIQVAAAEDVSHDELADRVAAAVGDGYTVQTAQQQADEQSAALEEGLSFITVLLTAFAVIALFVGSFIILNTFSMLVAQRTRELALLRALGAGRGQVTRSVLLEAVVLGVVGATAGLAGGFGIATGLRALFGTFGLTLDGDLVLSAGTVVWSYAVGVVVTVLAAWVPARRAARTPPVAAMRDDHVAVERSLRRRTGVGVALVAVAAGALAGSVATGDSGDAPAFVGVGGLALVLGAVALSPVLARPVVRVLGAPLPRLAGTAGRLARDNARRNPRRTAATASALMVGLTLVTGFGILGASANASVEALVDDTVLADYVVSTAVGQPFTPEVADRLRRLPEVDAVLQQRFTQVRLDGEETFAAAVDAATLDRGLTLEYLTGGSDGLAGRGLLVDEATAAEHGWEVGDTVAAESAGGQRTELSVGGVYAANQAVGSMVLSLDTDAALGGPALDRYVYVVLADGTDVAAARAALETVVEAYPVVGLKDRDEFAGEQKAQVDQVLMLINALLVLSVLIAVLGIVNTLALSVLERTREIGLLRAVGMDRRQLRRTVRLEAVLISVYGAVLGLGLGLVLGVGLTRALADQGITELVVPGAQLAGSLVLGALIGVVAAVWPARRAARLQVLDAIATA